jgi:hypothetical protein
MIVQSSLDVNMRPCLEKRNKAKEGGMAQLVELQESKYKALSSNPNKAPLKNFLLIH